MGFVRAGFLPSQAVWRSLAKKYGEQLRTLPHAPGEDGAAKAIEVVLADPMPQALRLLARSSDLTAPGTCYPRACAELLRSAAAAWKGSMDLGNPESAGLLDLYSAEYNRPRSA